MTQMKYLENSLADTTRTKKTFKKFLMKRQARISNLQIASRLEISLSTRKNNLPSARYVQKMKIIMNRASIFKLCFPSSLMVLQSLKLALSGITSSSMKKSQETQQAFAQCMKPIYLQLNIDQSFPKFSSFLFTRERDWVQPFMKSSIDTTLNKKRRNVGRYWQKIQQKTSKRYKIM